MRRPTPIITPARAAFGRQHAMSDRRAAAAPVAMQSAGLTRHSARLPRWRRLSENNRVLCFFGAIARKRANRPPILSKIIKTKTPDACGSMYSEQALAYGSRPLSRCHEPLCRGHRSRDDGIPSVKPAVASPSAAACSVVRQSATVPRLPLPQRFQCEERDLLAQRHLRAELARRPPSRTHCRCFFETARIWKTGIVSWRRPLQETLATERARAPPLRIPPSPDCRVADIKEMPTRASSSAKITRTRSLHRRSTRRSLTADRGALYDERLGRAGKRDRPWTMPASMKCFSRSGGCPHRAHVRRQGHLPSRAILATRSTRRNPAEGR